MEEEGEEGEEDAPGGHGQSRVGPWAAFAAGLVAMLASGTLYMYGAYEDDLKEKMELRQSEVEAIGYVGDAGTFDVY